MSALENYMTDIENRLHPLPAESRETELREARLHLQLLAAKYEAQGHSDPEAASIRQYGKPDAVAGKIYRAWRRGQREGFAKAVLFAFGITAVCGGITGVVSTASRLIAGFPFHSTMVSELLLSSVISAALFVGGGILFGMRYRGASALRGAFTGYLLEHVLLYAAQWMRISFNGSLLSVERLLQETRFYWPMEASIEVVMALSFLGGILAGYHLQRTDEKPDLTGWTALRFLMIALPIAAFLSYLPKPGLVGSSHSFLTFSGFCVTAAYALAGAAAALGAKRDITFKILLISSVYGLLVSVPQILLHSSLVGSHQLQAGSYKPLPEWLFDMAMTQLFAIGAATIAAALAYRLRILWRGNTTELRPTSTASAY